MWQSVSIQNKSSTMFLHSIFLSTQFRRNGMEWKKLGFFEIVIALKE